MRTLPFFLVAAAVLSGCPNEELEMLRARNRALIERVKAVEAENEALKRKLERAREIDIPPIQLPKTKEAEAGETLTVSIDAGGRLHLDGERVQATDLTRAAEEAGEGARADIAADAAVPHRRVVQVMDLLRSAGISRLALQVQTDDR